MHEQLQLTQEEKKAIIAYDFGRQLPENLQVAYIAALSRAAELGIARHAFIMAAMGNIFKWSHEELSEINALPFREE